MYMVRGVREGRRMGEGGVSGGGEGGCEGVRRWRYRK